MDYSVNNLMWAYKKGRCSCLYKQGVVFYFILTYYMHYPRLNYKYAACAKEKYTYLLCLRIIFILVIYYAVIYGVLDRNIIAIYN